MEKRQFTEVTEGLKHTDTSPLITPCVQPGSSCSKLTTSLVNETLKFQVKISSVNISSMPIFFVEKM